MARQAEKSSIEKLMEMMVTMRMENAKIYLRERKELRERDERQERIRAEREKKREEEGS